MRTHLDEMVRCPDLHEDSPGQQIYLPGYVREAAIIYMIQHAFSLHLPPNNTLKGKVAGFSPALTQTDSAKEAVNLVGSPSRFNTGSRRMVFVADCTALLYDFWANAFPEARRARGLRRLDEGCIR